MTKVLFEYWISYRYAGNMDTEKILKIRKIIIIIIIGTVPIRISDYYPYPS